MHVIKFPQRGLAHDLNIHLNTSVCLKMAR